MARSADQIAVLSGLGIKTIPAGLQDLEVIPSGIKAQDITINTASVDDLDVTHASIKSAGVYDHRSPRRIIYDDADPVIIAPTAPRLHEIARGTRMWDTTNSRERKIIYL
ncbi:hypothetical protein FB451DRAFT_1180580 [Mycena latifolia]|nr:hypothetical protein FB451DRAFT_1180580 [Mycena latifolia]